MKTWKKLTNIVLVICIIVIRNFTYSQLPENSSN